MSYTIKILGLLLLVALFEAGCKKEDPPCDDPSNQSCPNYDPCYTVKPVSAGFVARRISNYPDDPDFLAKDTFLRGGRVAFFAAEQDNPDTRYEWKIGSDNRTWEESTVVLSFSSQDVLNQCVPVRLIARRESSCLSAEEQIDTVERQICFIPAVDSLNPVYGRFRGATEDAPNAVYELEVSLEPYEHNQALWHPNIANLDNRGCTSVFFGTMAVDYRELFSELGGTFYATDCMMPAGADYDKAAFRDVHVKAYPNVDSIVIDYKVWAETPTGPYVEIASKRFKGVRVN